MTKPPAKDPQESMLLSYRETSRDLWIRYTVMILGVGLAFLYVWAVATLPSMPMLEKIVRLSILGIAGLCLIGIFTRSTIGLSCTASNIRVTTHTGLGYNIPWKDVTVLRRIRPGFVLLKSKGRLPFLLRISAQVHENLIAILRETSNARIVGFGRNETI